MKKNKYHLKRTHFQLFLKEWQSYCFFQLGQSKLRVGRARETAN